MDKIIKPTKIDFKELVSNQDNALLFQFKSKTMEILRESLTESEQNWFIANLYISYNYHKTKDFPISLENVYEMIGFANKGNAKKTLINNFTEDSDYKISASAEPQAPKGGGTNKETIMLNSETFKNLCMIAKTEKGKQMRTYYMKLERILEEMIEKERLEHEKELQKINAEKDRQLNEKNKLLEEKSKELDNLHSEISFTREQGKVLYGFGIENDRFKCGVAKVENLEARERNFKVSTPQGKMKYTVKVRDTFAEKIMHYIMKKKMTWVGGEIFQGDFETVKHIMDITCKFEALLISTDTTELKTMNDGLNMLINCENLERIGTFDSMFKKESIIPTVSRNVNPENTVVSKAKRPVDQIDKESGVLVASYKTLQSAGSAMGCSGEAIGIAVRNQKQCKGYLWRYRGVSAEEQFSNQPVMKIECSTGNKTSFLSLGDAAKDAGLSTAGLRNRIITNVHRDGFHWIWNVGAREFQPDSSEPEIMLTVL